MLVILGNLKQLLTMSGVASNFPNSQKIAKNQMVQKENLYSKFTHSKYKKRIC